MKVKHHASLFTLTLYLIIDTSHCLFFNAPRNHKGTISPKDVKICDGQSVTFQCKLKETPTLNSKLYFAVKIPKKSNDDYVIVNDYDVTREGDTSAKFTLVALPEPSMQVKCYYGQRSDVNKESNMIQPPVLFPVITMPRQVRDFRCIVNDYKEMICSWDFGIEYNMEVKPRVVLEWRVSGSTNSTEWSKCSEQSIENLSCKWDNSRDGIEWLNKLDIRVKLEQDACNVTVISNYTINTLLLVKPSPINNLRSHVINSTCVQLSWNKPNPPLLPSIQHVYKIELKSIWGTKEVIADKTQICDIQDNKELFTYCHLEENTEYSFIVTHRPRDGGYWSDDVIIKTTTFKDVPGSSPSLINGGYYWEPKECENGKKMRTVCLLWQGIKASDKNGDMRGLDLIFKPTGNDAQEEHRVFSEDTTYACARLHCNTAYRAEVTARNEIGTAKKKSSILIHKWESDIHHPSISVEMSKESNNGLSTVYISYTPIPPVTSDVYIVWCVKSMGQCKSDGEVNWERITNNDSVVSLNVSSPEQYLYSVVINTDNGFSYGAYWEECIHTRGVAPSRSPSNVKVTAGGEDNTLVVKWEELTCQSGEPRIINYRVEYCNTVNKKCSVKEVPYGTTRVVLQDLIEDEEYSIKIQALADHSLEGPYSQPIVGTPEYNSLKLHVIIVLGCGGFICIILAIFGCVVTARLIRKEADRWKQKMGDIKLPDNLGQDDIKIDVDKNPKKLFIRQQSADSGVPATPSPTVVNDLDITW